MISRANKARPAERGVVLITSLLLLIVVTIIALSLFRSFGMQEKIGGNMREKQRALQAAESAQVFAEIWLTTNAATAISVNCATMLNGNIGEGQICGNTLASLAIDVTKPPYQVAPGVNAGVNYLPGPPASLMSVNTTASVANVANPTYYGTPGFYISDMGPSADPTIPGEIYQIDAYGWGGSQNTVAVVESNYAVYTTSKCLGC